MRDTEGRKPDGDSADDEVYPRLLAERARTGVRVLHPGANTDRQATWYGVRIWEYEPTMVHAKTVVADESWCAVGTTNFDSRSMALNDEGDG